MASYKVAFKPSYLSLEDAQKLDAVREALRSGDLAEASSRAFIV